MAEFLATHGRTAATLLVAMALIPFVALAQDQSGPSPDRGDAGSAPQVGTASQDIPPAVAKQLEAMQKRIEQLERELNTRGPVASNSALPTHDLTEQSSPANSGPQAAESAVSQNPPANEKPVPFAFADFSWLNGNSRIKEVPFDTKFFTPEIRSDVNYTHDFHDPQDDTIGGSSEIFRANEFQLTQFGVGGDFHWDNVQARLMTQFGLYSQTTPRNDASPARGQWQLADAYRYISEAYGGYHWDVWD
ncbi:MAG: outer membrane beta-barrel protein, partial [Candidatus Korobacteraceae bacterium]